MRISKLCDNFQQPNICVIKVPEVEKKQGVQEKHMKNNDKFTNLVKSTVHSVKFYKGKRNILKTAPKHIMIKLTKPVIKAKILKAAREKRHITYKRMKIRMTKYFLTEAI